MTARKRPLSYRLARLVGGSRTHTFNAGVAAATAAVGAVSLALPALQDQLGPWPFAALSVLAAAGNAFLRALPRTGEAPQLAVVEHEYEEHA